MWPNISYLYKAQIGYMGEYFKLARNYWELEVYYKDAAFCSGRWLDNKDNIMARWVPNGKGDYLVLWLALVIYKDITYLG